MNGRRWTKNEVWELLDLAQEVGQEQAARQLGRTLYALQVPEDDGSGSVRA